MISMTAPAILNSYLDGQSPPVPQEPVLWDALWVYVKRSKYPEVICSEYNLSYIS